MSQLDSDLLNMSEQELREEVMKMRTAIRTHRDQKGDENCWLDDQFYLYGLLPEGTNADPQLPDKELMMLNCSRYYDCRKAGKLYIPLTTLPEDKTIDVKSLSDDELWLLTCGIEELHDSMRHNREEYVEGIVDKTGDIREALESECTNRKLDHKRWQR